MDDAELARYWNGNADAWTELSRAGYDIYRDELNTPAFLGILPTVKGLRGLDIGCGEGTNTRSVASLGASMSAIDIASRFIEHARKIERKSPMGITYQVASAHALPFPDEHFDFAVAFMSLMDLPDQPRALAEAWRILKPGGFFQFSITHPCFDTPHRRNLRDENRQTYAIEVGGYFDRIDGRIDRWLFGAAPRQERDKHPAFEVPVFHRTLSEWVNMVIRSGFTIEQMAEPKVSEKKAREIPQLQDTRVVAYFLHVRCRKPGR
jgi:ubiquinone/menaquinone biosynthesis C-methylase UbiE